MTVTILKIQQNSERWLVEREGKVTGSISDTLLTRNLEDALKLNYNRFNGNYYTERGHILEEEALEIYGQINSCTVTRPGMVLNDAYPNAACSPDGLDGEWLLEVKAFSIKKHMGIATPSDIPFKIMSQLQFNMMICELKQSKLIMYNPDCENPKDCYREIVIKANKQIHARFKAKLEGKI